MDRIELKIGDRVYHEGSLNMYSGPYVVVEIVDCIATIKNKNGDEKKIRQVRKDHMTTFEQVDKGWGGFWVLEDEKILEHCLRNEAISMIYSFGEDNFCLYDFEDLSTDQLRRIKEILEEFMLGVV